MRSPSHFVFMTLVACIGLAASSTAFAGSAEPVDAIDPASFHSITRVELGDAHEKLAAARIDERLSLGLSGPTSMDCSNDAETGYETCVVRTQSTMAPVPASIAQN
ncbi:hypothetical protein K2X89_16980 [Myxococcota bacterium]|nr:hypothetical protein [Myxococcota bacterium]